MIARNSQSVLTLVHRLTFLLLGDPVTDSLPLLTATSADGVRTLTLNRPDRLNAVNPALAEALPRAMHEAAADDAVRVIVITGSGRGFCAGLDLSEPVPINSGPRAERLDPYYWVGRWVLTRVEIISRKPRTALVGGGTCVYWAA